MATLHELSFPFQGLFKVRMAAFAVAELRGVYAAAAARLGFGVEDVVEHFVVDDEFDEELGHVGAVESGVDADEAVAGIVAAKYDMSARSSVAGFRGAAAPAYIDFEFAIKELLIDLFGEFVEIVDSAAGTQVEDAFAGGFDFRAGPVIHVMAQDGVVCRAVADDILGKGVFDFVGCVEEHPVDTEAQGRSVAGAHDADEGAGVIVDAQIDGPADLGFQVLVKLCCLIAVNPCRTYELGTVAK